MIQSDYSSDGDGEPDLSPSTVHKANYTKTVQDQGKATRKSKAQGQGEGDGATGSKSIINTGAVTPSYVTQLLNSNPLVLCLEGVGLQDLSVLEPLAATRLSDVVKMSLARNYLESIDWLESLQHLKKIDAKDNYIRQVSLSLPTLQDLDLCNNFVEKVPNLSLMPALHRLVLKSNNIEELRLKCSVHSYANLVTLDVSQNKIRMTAAQMERLADKLARFKRIKLFNFDNNRDVVLEGEPYKKLVTQLPPSVEMFNNQRRVVLQAHIREREEQQIWAQKRLRLNRMRGAQSTSALQVQMSEIGEEESKASLRPQFGAQAEDQGQLSKRKTKESVASTQVPTLELMLYNVEQASNHASKSIYFLKQLYIQTDMVLAMQSKALTQQAFDRLFTQRSDLQYGEKLYDAVHWERVDESVDKFMQFAQLLIDNQVELRDMLLSILSKLTVVRTRDFGAKCFSTFKDLMLADASLGQQVRHHIDIHIITKLNDLPPKDTSVGLLKGLQSLVDDHHLRETKLVSILFKDFFPKWLVEIKELIFLKTQPPQISYKMSQIDAVLSLMTAAVREDQENVNTVVESHMHEELAQIFLKTPCSTQKARYLHLVQCITEIARLHSGAASDFISAQIHHDLITDTKLTFYQFKKQQDFKVSDDADQEHLSRAERAQKYRVFSAQIKMLAALINAEPQDRGEVLLDGLVRDLPVVATYSKADPLLLASVSFLINQVLHGFTVSTIDSTGHPVSLSQAVDVRIEDEIGSRVRKMEHCEHLLGYLGFSYGTRKSKFDYILRAVRLYDGEQADGSGARIDHEEIDHQHILDQLDDPIIEDLFVQVIKIVDFFCRELARLQAKRKAEHGVLKLESDRMLMAVYEQVCGRMNEIGREDALFNCLRIPNDTVKLAVVDCLLNVPICQLDDQEIRDLLSLVQNYQNIGVGQTELVLAKIFQIFSNIVQDTSPQSKETVAIFKNSFIEESIKLAINIITRNQRRKVDEEDEETEKITLSLSIVNFFKYTSKDNLCRKVLARNASQQDTLKAILDAEQHMTVSAKFVLTPIGVESTQMGKSFRELANLIAAGGFNSLEPYTFVSFRVIHQMANLLQLDKYKELYEPTDIGGAAEIGEVLIADYQRLLQKRISMELQLWGDFNRVRHNDLWDQLGDAQADHYDQHKTFTLTNGVKSILHFLTAYKSQCENWLRSHCDPSFDHVGSPSRHEIYGYSLTKAIRKELKTVKRAQQDAKAPAKKVKAYEKVTPPAETEMPRRTTMAVKKIVDKNDPNLKKGKRLLSATLGEGYAVSATELFLNSRKQSLMTRRLRLRQKAASGIENADLRCLCIAAFLRCLHASIEDAPDFAFAESAIANIASPEIFLQVTKLCSSTGWFQANIGIKYLQLARYVLRIDTTRRVEDHSEGTLHKYELLSFVLQRILGLLAPKVRATDGYEESLIIDELILLCHVAILCNQIVQQTALFDWTQPGATPDRLMSDQLPEPESQDRRYLRKHMVSFMLTRLFPLEVVHTLVEALFSVIHSSQVQNQHGRYSGKKQKVWSQASSRFVENVKKFLSWYLVHCQSHKYAVLSHLMQQVCFRGRKVRASLLEEVLEGAHQLETAQARLGLLLEDERQSGAITHSLALKHFCEIAQFTGEVPLTPSQPTASTSDKKRAKRGSNFVSDVLSQVALDCQMGERILFSQPMPIHIMSSTHQSDHSMGSDYRVMTLTLTNHGAYIQSSNAHGSDGSFDTLSFNFKQVKAMSTTEQHRIVLKIDIPLEKTNPWWTNFQSLSDAQSQDGEEAKDTLNPMNRRRLAGGAHSGAKQKSMLYLTLIVPKKVDSITLSEIFKEALLQTQGANQDIAVDEQLIKEDSIVQILLIEAVRQLMGRGLRVCPLCDEDRSNKDCKCPSYMTYCYKVSDLGTLSRVENSQLRGGPSSLLDPLKQAKLGLLLISPSHLFFARERPDKWRQMPDASYTSLFKLATASQEKVADSHHQSSQSARAHARSAIKHFYSPSETWSVSMAQIKSMQLGSGKVPALEFDYLESQGRVIKSVCFAMLSDSSAQECLIELGRLKREAYRRQEGKNGVGLSQMGQIEETWGNNTNTFTGSRL